MTLLKYKPWEFWTHTPVVISILLSKSKSLERPLIYPSLHFSTTPSTILPFLLISPLPLFIYPYSLLCNSQNNWIHFQIKALTLVISSAWKTHLLHITDSLTSFKFLVMFPCHSEVPLIPHILQSMNFCSLLTFSIFLISVACFTF